MAGEGRERTSARKHSIAKMAAGLVALLLLGVMASGALADGDPFSAITAITGTSTSSNDGSSTSSTGTDTTGVSTDATTSDTSSTADATTTDSATTTVSTTTTGTTSAASTPTIASDQSDYPPGSMVTLSGSGWGGGESVHLFVNDTIGQTWSYNADVVADLNGGFTTSFQLPNSFVSSYDVTATGAGGETAIASFTDASLKIYPAPAGSGVSFTLTYQGFTNNSCTTGGGSTDTMTVSNDTGGETVQTGGSGVLNGKTFVKFTAPPSATAPSGWTFVSWSDGPSSSNHITTTTSASICVRIPTGGNNDTYRATYAASTDTTPPTVSSINTLDASPTNSIASVHWTVTFSESVTGVDTGDFSLANTGLSGPAISGVTGTGTTYTVTASSGTGSGTLGLNLVDNDTVVDGAGNKLGGTGTTGAANGSFAGQLYTIDRAAPSSAIQCNVAACVSTFYGADVSVTLSASDTGGSGVKEIRYTLDGTTTPDATHGAVYSGAFLVSSSTTVKFAAIDNAGNVESAHTQTINVDKTPPTVTANVVGTLGDNGWYVSNVNVSFTIGDPESGIATQSADCAGHIISTDQAATAYTCSVTNGAGLSASASVTIKRDTTAPLVTVSLVRTPDANGWYNHAVGYGVSAKSDATSGIDSCQPDATYSGPDDGAALVTRSCTDLAGNVGSDSASFRYDSTAPAGVATALARPADHNGWYNHAVGWATAGTDATSGIDTCSSGTYSGPDGTGLTVSGSCTDNAGNTSASADSASFRYDNTAPNLGITDTNVATENLCGSVLPTEPVFAPSDATSGIDTGGTGDTWTPSTAPSGVGTYTYSAHATDQAGNTAFYGPKSYLVLYGNAVVAAVPFLQPINADGSSRFKLGSTVPVKFQAKCNGVPVSNVVAKMYVKQGDSQPDPGVDEAISTSAATTGNLFRWTGSPDNQYIFNLSTKLGYNNPDNTVISSFAQGTWTLKIGLDDGSFRSINVQLAK